MGAFKNLPTAWIKLDMNGSIISLAAEREIPKGYDHWYLAKCHYRIGKTGEREFINRPMTSIAEALLVKEHPNYPGNECIERRYVYGVQKWPESQN